MEDEFKERCDHGNYPAWCDQCNGNAARKEEERAFRKRNTQTRLRKKLQYLTVQEADRNNDPIEDWEIEYFLNNASPEDKKYKLMFMHELAIYFQRTLESMMWWDLIAWSEGYKKRVFDNPTDLHCKALILRFEDRKKTLCG